MADLQRRNFAKTFTLAEYQKWLEGEGATVDLVSVITLTNRADLLVTWRASVPVEPRVRGL